MNDPREIIIERTDEVQGKPFMAERSPRQYDWESHGYGKTPEEAKSDLFDKEWDWRN